MSVSPGRVLVVVAVAVALLAVLPVTLAFSRRPSLATAASTVERPATDYVAEQRQSAVVDIQRPVGRPLEVTFIGDSLTVNSFAGKDSDSFRGIITSAWSKGGNLDVSKYARSGATTAEVAALVPPEVHADVIFVELGINDNGHEVPLSKVRADYGGLIDQLRASSPHAALFCVGLWGDAESMADIDGIVGDVCNYAGGRHIPVSDLFSKPNVRGPTGTKNALGQIIDDFHPNKAGHALLAQRILTYAHLT